MNRVAIVGYGSIGKRHYSVFKELGVEVSLITRQNVELENVYSDLVTCLDRFIPDVIIICNKTAEHVNTFKNLIELRFSGIVLVEKPIFEKKYKYNSDQLPFTVKVAYNLRFHPVLRRLKSELQGRKIISAIVYCGQYLPTWRPSVDYRKNYSASKSGGGGALRDLSHELDYSSWIFGEPNLVTAIGGHFSSLEIDSDDTFSILAQTSRCPCVNITINYLNRSTQRFIIVNCDDSTYKADLIQGTLTKNNELLCNYGLYTDSYHDQGRALLKNDDLSLCSYEDGVAILDYIEAIELAHEKKEWVHL